MRTEAGGTIELGIQQTRVDPGAHIAYLWETAEEFERGVTFLEIGLKGRDHGIIFGHPDANDRVARILTARGHDVLALQRQGKLTILLGLPKGDVMLETIGSTFQHAVQHGAPVVRLLGNIGWGHKDWPSEKEILAFEAKVTEAAKAFPCVVMCMYDVGTLSGRVIVNGGYCTHPLTIHGNVMRENPHHVPIDEYLERLK